MEAGLDSLASVELRNNLASSFRLDMPATVIFDYPNAKALAEYLHSQQAQGPTTGAAGLMSPLFVSH